MKPSLRLSPMTRMAIRSLIARPSRTLLTLAGIVLGVGVILAISITNLSTVESIKDLFAEASGNAQLMVISAASNEEGFAGSIAGRARSVAGVQAVSPVVQAHTSLATVEVGSDRTASWTGLAASGILLYGIDPVADRAIRDYVITSGQYLGNDLSVRQIVVVADWAEDNHITVGRDISLLTPSGVQEVRVVGLMSKQGPGKLNNGAFGIMPLGAVQDLFDRGGEVDSIEIVVAPGSANAVALENLKESLQARLGADYAVIYPATQGERVARMLDSYQMGLSFFSGMALFVGVFLIYNAFSMTVVERTREIGMLRAVGMTKRQVRRQILVEAIVLGLAGALLGVLLGVLLSTGLIRAMESLVSQDVSRIRIPLQGLLTSLLVGLGVTLLAAMLPAWQAGRVSPLEALRVRGRSREPWMIERGWPVGAALVAIALIFMFGFPSAKSELLQGLNSMALTLAFGGATLLVPEATAALDRVVRWPVIRVYGNEGRIGAANVQRSRLRTALTVAALMVGVSMTIAVGALTTSFKRDVGDWIGSYIGGDLYVHGSMPLRTDLAERIGAVDGVEAVTPLRYTDATWVQPDGNKLTVQIRATDPLTYRQVTEFNFVNTERSSTELATEMAEGDVVFVSTIMAEKHGVAIGDVMTLQTRRGLRAFRVSAVVVDYMQQGLTIQGSWKDMRRYFGINDAQFFLVKTRDGVDPEAVKEQITDQFGKRSHLTVQSNQVVKSEALGITSQTFAMFDVLSVISMVVAALGVINTLTMSVVERTREIGMLRSVGMTRAQIWRMILSEAALIGLVGGLFGLLVGMVLARLFILGASNNQGYAVNFYVPWVPVLTSVLVSLVVSQLAAMLPARRAARLRIISAIQFE